MKQRGYKILSLIPLDLDGYLFSDKWRSGKAEQVKSRVTADFTKSSSDEAIFEASFRRLVKALRADDYGRKKTAHLEDIEQQRERKACRRQNRFSDDLLQDVLSSVRSANTRFDRAFSSASCATA
ncbi:hypothetical protein [Nitrosospira sp. Nl5]|uniref:hypothetical protein n=1 Tax=Nitrosospira sp. Nl5 TaxID=200120 RepID=UPI0015A296EC|nr:hypothetical protein [Nitrosospira sp. Nl5]